MTFAWSRKMTKVSTTLFWSLNFFTTSSTLVSSCGICNKTVSSSYESMRLSRKGTHSIRIHKDLGFKARDYLESILEEELILSFGTEIFDRYERPLVYLSAENQDTYNLRLVRAGYYIPYFIYPNAVSPAEDGEWSYDTLQEFREATVEAADSNLGIWRYMDYSLIPMELRYLTRREPPLKYCADLENDLLYSPQYYFKIPIEDRLFFYPKDVLLALQKEFKPAPECEGWLHRVWRSLHGGMKEEEKVKAEIERKKRKKRKRRR